MCRIDLCGQIGVKISSYGDRRFIKLNPLNCPMGQFIPREDRVLTFKGDSSPYIICSSRHYWNWDIANGNSHAYGCPIPCCFAN